MAKEVPRSTTPVDEAAMRSIIEQVYPLVFGREPTPGEVAMYMAHLHLETGGYDRIIQHNPGNISAGGIYAGKEKFNSRRNYWRPPWFADDDHTLHQYMLDGKAPSAFRAYSNLGAGVQDYFAVLKKRPAMVEAARAGDAGDFATAVRESGYTPDLNVGPVTDSLARLSKRYGGTVEGHTRTRPKGGPWLIWGAVGLLGTTMVVMSKKRG